MKTTNEHCKAYVCTHVFDGSRPVLLVSRPDGDWCFLCGDEHLESASAYKVVGIGHLFQRDPSLEPLADLSPEWEAEREAMGADWIRTSIEMPSSS